MKNIRNFLILFLLTFALSTSSCDILKMSCEGMGTLKLTNKSHNTVHRIMIDGVNYGTLDPDESKEYRKNRNTRK